MTPSTARWVFALVCVLAMIAVGMGALLEFVRFRRAARQAALSGAPQQNNATLNALAVEGSLLSRRQLVLRLLSALLWMGVLSALAYATTALWPEGGRTPAAIAQARLFVRVVGGALCLLVLALALLAYDVVLLARTRRAQTARFYQGLAELAREEAARARSQPPDQTSPGQTPPAPTSPAASPPNDATSK